MHVRSFGMLAVIGVGITVGCQGGSGPDAEGGSFDPGDGYETPPSSYDTPASSYDPPPSDGDAPPDGFETPPGDGSADTTRICERICRAVLASGCAQGNVDQAGCARDCSANYTESYDVCLEQLIGVLECVLRSPSFNCGNVGENSEIDEGAFAECEVPVLAFNACYGVEEPEPPGPGPDDNLGGAGNL